jgi:serine/threonine protein kinase
MSLPLPALNMRHACRRTPFYAPEAHETFRKIDEGVVNFPRKFDESAQKLVSSLLTNDPRTRLGSLAGGAEDVKQHAFFAPVDWSSVVPRVED